MHAIQNLYRAYESIYAPLYALLLYLVKNSTFRTRPIFRTTVENVVSFLCWINESIFNKTERLSPVRIQTI